MPLDAFFNSALEAVARVEQRFSQEAGLAHLTTLIRGQVGGGYCLGACQNWLRRKLMQEPVVLKDRGGGMVTAMVQQLAQTHIDSNAATATSRREAGEAATAALNEAKAVAQEKLDAWFRINGATKGPEGWSTPPPGSIGAAIIDKELSERQDTFKKAIKLAESAFGYALRKAGKHIKGKATAPLNEAELRRLAHDTLAGTCKTLDFSKIVPVYGEDARYVNPKQGVSGFLCRAISTAYLKNGRGVLFNFQTGKAEGAAVTVELPPGHAVAVYRKDLANYILFDPNLGIYGCNSRKNLLHALILLLMDGYEKSMTEKEHDTWIVYCKTDDLVPTIQPVGPRRTDPPQNRVQSSMKSRRSWLTRAALGGQRTPRRRRPVRSGLFMVRLQGRSAHTKR